MQFYCDYGKHYTDAPSETIGTGYATVFGTDQKVCYECAAKRDREQMSLEGRYTLYLTGTDDKYEITNWPGTLRFPVRRMATHRHNWGLKSHYVWFTGPDGYLWWGVSIGENTELCHCKRTQERVRE